MNDLTAVKWCSLQSRQPYENIMDSKRRRYYLFFFVFIFPLVLRFFLYIYTYSAKPFLAKVKRNEWRLVKSITSIKKTHSNNACKPSETIVNTHFSSILSSCCCLNCDRIRREFFYPFCACVHFVQSK